MSLALAYQSSVDSNCVFGAVTSLSYFFRNELFEAFRGCSPFSLPLGELDGFAAVSQSGGVFVARRMLPRRANESDDLRDCGVEFVSESFRSLPLAQLCDISTLDASSRRTIRSMLRDFRYSRNVPDVRLLM